MSGFFPKSAPIQPTFSRRLRPWEYDDFDYKRGWAMGRKGLPEPRNVNYATWQGWRDASAKFGHIERIDVFRKRP